MKRAEKAIAIFLVFILLVSVLAGCGKKEEPADKTTDIPGDAAADITGDGEAGAGNEKTGTPKPAETPPATPEASKKPAVETPEPTPAGSEEPSPEPPKPSEGSEPGSGKAGEADPGNIYGTVEGNTYVNKHFGFSLPIPEGWYIASREEFAQMLSVFAGYLGSGEGETVDLEAEQIIPLLFASVYPLDYSDGTNPYISIMARNISKYAFVKDARIFLNLQAQVLKSQDMGFSFGDVEAVSIGGQELARIKGVQDFLGVSINQDIYAFLKDEFVVLFTLSSFNGDEARLLEDVMKGVTFR